MNGLDPRVVNVWRLSGLVRLATFWLPVLGTAGAMLAWQVSLPLGVAIAAVGLMGVAALTLYWPSLTFRAFGWGIREHDLVVRQGVLFRHEVSIPLDRIQHVDLRQGPIERASGLFHVIVYTAAGMNADGSIPGLAEADAERLRDRLVRRGGDDGV